MQTSLKKYKKKKKSNGKKTIAYCKAVIYLHNPYKNLIINL